MIASHNDRVNNNSNESAVEGGAQTQTFCLVEGAQAVALQIDDAINKVNESRKQNKSMPEDTQERPRGGWRERARATNFDNNNSINANFGPWSKESGRGYGTYCVPKFLLKHVDDSLEDKLLLAHVVAKWYKLTPEQQRLLKEQVKGMKEFVTYLDKLKKKKDKKAAAEERKKARDAESQGDRCEVSHLCRRNWLI